jgi:ABC-2 type transport system permease protein
MNTAKDTVRKNDLMLLGAILAIVLFLNIINQYVFFRLDLTSEKRYTLHGETREILHELNDIVFISVYLDGELNIPFKKFQDNIRDMLDEFKVYGKSRLHYEFINPLENVASAMHDQIISDLYEKGLRPTNIHQRDKEGGTSEKIVFPSAIVSYRNIEVPVNLLLNNPGTSAEQNLNNSIEALEYSLISTIRNITNERTEKIAFIEGHGELSEAEVSDISRELSKSYQIDRGHIQGQPGIMDDYKVIIIAKPTLPFSEPDKFVIDQYIMQGGNVLWLIDAVQVSLDSLVNGETIAFISDINLEDLLFRYGVRINPVLVQDIQCNVIPVNVALQGNAPDFKPVPWLYFPLLSPKAGHPVTRNLNFVWSRFANSIDTIGARSEIRKTILLNTSEFSRERTVPTLISLGEVQETPGRAEFSREYLITAALLEGEFQSAFMNRGIDQYYQIPPQIITRGKKTRMAIIADGDIIRNETRTTAQGVEISPLGYDRFTRQTFGNKEFLSNLIHFLADDKNLLSLRNREFKLRLLSKEKIQAERTRWILINMLMPSLLVLLLGLGYILLRKFRFSKVNHL